MNKTNYKVFPKKPVYQSERTLSSIDNLFIQIIGSPSKKFALGSIFSICLFLFFLYKRSPIVEFYLNWYRNTYTKYNNGADTGAANFAWIASFLITLIVLLVPIFKFLSSLLKEMENFQSEIEKTKLNNIKEYKYVQSEAENTTNSLLNNYEQSISLKTELSENLEQATLWLKDAEFEYKDNAFTPFWDAVENAARHLAKYDKKVNELGKNAQKYYQLLDNREHNFPVFPVPSNTIPDSTFVIKEFRRIVRLGQKNHKFDNNYGHRRTHQILIEGFNSLGDAINNLPYAIEDSLNDFQQTISSDSARIVEEQIKTRETIHQTGKSIDKRLVEQNRMLDNIQHDRKPKLKDTPSKQ